MPIDNRYQALWKDLSRLRELAQAQNDLLQGCVEVLSGIQSRAKDMHNHELEVMAGTAIDILGNGFNSIKERYEKKGA